MSDSNPVERREFLCTGAIAGLGWAGSVGWASSNATQGPAEAPAPELEEATVAALQAKMAAGACSARTITEGYLSRIAALDQQGPELRSVIEVNPDAAEIAASLDAERQSQAPRGPLHGIPVLLKDNIDTADRMQTTAGSLALAGVAPARDATVAERLRAAGAVLLGKANLSEWANFRSTRSSSGWSARGGQCKNPYALDRNPCGSSSGSAVAVAANLCALAVGTETDGSIVCPSSANGIVGLKPTVGLISRAGIVPIAHSQDTAGPMARTVRDAALLLSALVGTDPRDGATQASAGRLSADYTRSLDPDGLRAARLGVWRKHFDTDPRVGQLMEGALAQMRQCGAVLVDPVQCPAFDRLDEPELDVLLFEFKADLAAHLGGLGPAAPLKTLADVIRFNEQHRAAELPFFGQDLFIRAQAKGPLTSPAYRTALATCRRLARKNGIDALMARHQLDAIVAPTSGPAWLTDLVSGDHESGVSCSTPPAVAGYPHVTVPLGFVFGLPVGLSFFGSAWSEPTLLRLAYAFEQAAHARRAPSFRPTVDLAARSGQT